MIVLDTHVLVWLALEPERLSRPAKRAITLARAADGIAVASTTWGEIAQNLARGRLRYTGTVRAGLAAIAAATDVAVLALTMEVAALAAELPEPFPSDPADRYIAATAIAARAALVTKDAKIRASGVVKTVW